MTIQQALTKIQNESYGEDVRAAIVSGLQLCYDERAFGGYNPVDNLNNYYNGVALFSTNTANAPIQSSIIVMSAGNDTHCCQVAINTENINNNYFRRKENNSWSNWVQIGIYKKLRYWNYDGSVLLYTEPVESGQNGIWSGTSTRTSTPQYDYTFVGWSTSTNASVADANARKNITTDRDVYAAFSAQTRSYTVSFYNGSSLLATRSVLYGSNASDSGIATPTKASTAQYDYTFVGWNSQNDQASAEANVLNNITGNKTVYAAYTSVLRSYNVYFYNGSSLLDTVSVTYGGTAVYSGSTTPTKASTAQYTYTFAGWNTQDGQTSAESGALTNITANRTVYAAFSRTVRTYTVRFMNGTTVLQTVNNVAYGSDATYTGSTPVHPTAPDEYMFVGFDPDGTNITGNTDCQAVYILNPKDLRYWNYNGTELLHTEQVEVGGNGTWNGTSSRASTAEHSYVFLGWSTSMNATVADANATRNVTADRDVYAAFEETTRSYSVYFYNGTTLLYTDHVQYGENAAYVGSTPTKASTVQYEYTFAGWNSQNGQSSAEANVLNNIIADKTVYAAFSSALIPYYVYFYNNSTLLYTDTVSYGSNASYIGNSPTKASTAQYEYTFAGWNSQNGQSTAEANVLNNITANKIVYAAFSEAIRYYTVRFMNGDTVLQSSQVAYGMDAEYIGEPPVHPTDPDGYNFAGWEPDGTNIAEDTDCFPIWVNTHFYARDFIERTLSGTYENDKIYTITQQAFAGCINLEKAIFPNVTGAGYLAFDMFEDASSTKLSWVELPKVSSISNMAFRSCARLKTLIVGTEISEVCKLGHSNAFDGVSGTLKIYVPDEYVQSYRTASVWSDFAAKISGISYLPNS